MAVEPADRVVAEGDGVADVQRRQAVFPAGFRAVAQVDRRHGEQDEFQHRLAQQQHHTGPPPPEQVADGQSQGQQHPEADLTGGDQPDDHGSLLSVTLSGSRAGRPASSSPVTNLRYIERCSAKTVPGHKAAGARAVLDGFMAAPLPRPHRFDVAVATGGLLGGLLLWVIGLGVRPADEPIVLFDGRWPILLPLLLMTGCELLRRSAPRTALLAGDGRPDPGHGHPGQRRHADHVHRPRVRGRAVRHARLGPADPVDHRAADGGGDGRTVRGLAGARGVADRGGRRGRLVRAGCPPV